MHVNCHYNVDFCTRSAMKMLPLNDSSDIKMMIGRKKVTNFIKFHIKLSPITLKVEVVRVKLFCFHVHIIAVCESSMFHTQTPKNANIHFNDSMLFPILMHGRSCTF